MSRSLTSTRWLEKSIRKSSHSRCSIPSSKKCRSTAWYSTTDTSPDSAPDEPLYDPRATGIPDFKVFKEVEPLRDYRSRLPFARRTVGLVPTMGALHDGHLALIQRAAQENTDVFVSIFVNPTQFGVTEDLSSYPRTYSSDMDQLFHLDQALAMGGEPGRISAVFHPGTKTMYPTLPPTSEVDGDGSFVNIKPLDRMLEGASRPIFFRGVATVCMKLFNIVQPNRVYFGQKDIQQTVVIKRMVKDFHLDTQVRVERTRREKDGLAMSSRNRYLGTRRRIVANVLYRALMAAEDKYKKGKARSREEIMAAAEEVIVQAQERQRKLRPESRVLFEVDYISLADRDNMEELEVVNDQFGAIMSGAIKMAPVEEPTREEKDQSTVRLIDNRILPVRRKFDQWVVEDY